MSQIKGMPLEELAAFVSSHLASKGIAVVLTGGACVTMYTENKYQSMDIDLVNMDGVAMRIIVKAMAEIGFYEKERMFAHPETEFTVDMLAPPLSLGSSSVHEIVEKKVGQYHVRLLSVSDSVCDRLAAWFFWDDEQALHQALMICENGGVDLDVVEKWADSEGELQKFRGFIEILKSKGN